MNNQTIKEIQNKELEILLYFQKFCEEHHLMFYLCGGSLIGAVRHKGFIPWDDDVDVFMPRHDYERLPKLWKKFADTKRYAYCRTGREHMYHDAGASIRDIHTTYINRHSVKEDICHGLALEIMPIDGCPSGRLARGFQLLHAMTFALFNAQRLPVNKGRAYRLVAWMVYKVIRSPKLRYRIWKRAERKMSKYSWDSCDEVTELVGSIKGMKLRHKKSDFDRVEYLEFEGHKVPVMKGYERYLTAIWGNYMQLPPPEQRVAKHDTAFIDLHTDYREYRGIHYCVENVK
ncbi:MAG: LicD family protein [Lachnospiraceae bacterium]|nr:LicD family protein [Lachnospiraceae bacterium]